MLSFYDFLLHLSELILRDSDLDRGEKRLLDEGEIDIEEVGARTGD